jgi:hypothetical protein
MSASQRSSVVIAQYGDLAADLGRLLAEVSHSITQHGGSISEAVPFVHRTMEYYRSSLPSDWDAETLYAGGASTRRSPCCVSPEMAGLRAWCEFAW